MADNTSNMLSMITNTSGKVIVEGGQPVSIPNPKFLKYRFLDIKANNIPAFLKRLLDMEYLAETLQNDFTPLMAEVLYNDIVKQVENYEVSVTGAASEEGRFIKMMIADPTITHEFRDNTKRSFTEKIRDMGRHEDEGQYVRGEEYG